MTVHLEWHGDVVASVLEGAASRGIGDAADLIAETAQKRVPYRTKALMNSQQVEKNGLEAVIAYTDSKASAAHENLHVRLRHGRRAKFLESAADDKKRAAERAVADAIRAVL